MATLTLDDCVFMPEVDIHKHSGMVQHIKNHWWTVDPTRGLVFFPRGRRKELESSSPQCNSNEDIARRLSKNWPGTDIKFIESVLVPINVQDYCS